jgi:hypothetical protein
MAVEGFLKPDNRLKTVVTSGKQIIASLYGEVLYGLDILRLRLPIMLLLTINVFRYKGYH